MAKRGVELIVTALSQIIPPLLKFKRLQVAPFKAKGKTMRIITLEGGDASFLAGGVDVKFPGSRGYFRAFYAMDVYMIRDIGGDVIRRNAHLCPKCWRLTGNSIKEEPSQKLRGRIVYNMKCIKCDSNWTVTM